MKKNSLAVFFSIILSVVLTACGASLPEMTEEQNAQVVEYAAGLLLKYDKNYENRLLSEEEKEEKEKELQEEKIKREKEQEAAKLQMNASEEVSSQKDFREEPADVMPSSSIEEFYNIAGIRINYAGYEIVDSYPKETNDIMMLNAEKGSKLLILNFDVDNMEQTDMELDMVSVNPQMKISINEGTPEYALLTMLPDDLSSFSGIIAAGESKRLVLVDMISEDKAQDIGSVSLIMNNGTEEAKAILN